jgi:carbamoyltransferase
MYILGINAYHGDSSACIIKNGKIIAATEEERIKRIKHWAGLPIEAIKFCLKDAQVSFDEIDHITISRDPKAKFWQKLLHIIKSGSALQAIKDRGSNSLRITQIKNDLISHLGVRGTVKAKLHFIEHHRSHLASAFHVSPFNEAALLSIDGMGDFSSTMRGIGKGTQIKVIDSISYPHSLGIFYTTFTQYLGFPHYGDEYKVMGLAPYGVPKYVDRILNKVIHQSPNGKFRLNSQFFNHFKAGVTMSWDDGTPVIDSIYTEDLVEEFGPKRKKGEGINQYHRDLAASIQKSTEEIIFYMAEDLFKKTGLDHLCITGGVAQNSVANGKLIQNTSFKKLFVPPAGHDAGTSIGSALYLYHHNLKNPRTTYKPNPYTGIKFSNLEIENYLQKRKIPYKKLDDKNLVDFVSDQLIKGCVIGWFQGRAEFGPRALGNRSILVDPRRADAKELLNKKIKKRESFRPFAPSILKEYMMDYFSQHDDVPFMEKVFDIKPEKQSEIPAVTHVNGTGRLQTVDINVNHKYHSLISAFHEKTGVPILLNTSFNENEPIVNTPEHALDCYLRTNMDLLVLENCIVDRSVD